VEVVEEKVMPVSMSKLKEMVNFNYVGIVAASLSILVAIYNIQQYYKAVKSSRR